MEVSGQLHTPVALPQWNSPWYPLNRKLDGPHSWSWPSWEKTKIPCFCQDLNLRSPGSQPCHFTNCTTKATNGKKINRNINKWWPHWQTATELSRQIPVVCIVFRYSWWWKADLSKTSVAYQGGGAQNPPKIPKDLQNCAKLNQLWKLLKLLNLGRQHTKMFGKKAAKF